MRTYRELFRTPEFTPLFLTAAATVAAQTVSGLGLATLIYAATGSPLLSALAMFGPSLAQVVGATVLLSAADRLPPRAALSLLALAFAVGTAALALPGLAVGAAFGVVLALGVLGSLGGGVRYGLLNEVLPRDGYLLGRSVFNMAAGAMQICGFATGGILVTALSPRGTLLTGAALYAAAALCARCGLSRRPPRATGRASARATWRTNALLWSSRPRRYTFLVLWVPNGLIVGCESLYVPYAPRNAGLLFACAALGMLAGDIVTGRFVPAHWRSRLRLPLNLLLAAPYLAFALDPSLPVAVAAVVLSSAGYSASLLHQERLMALTPDELSGHALGLHASGMLTMQGVGAALAGAVAQWTSPADAMALVSTVSVAVALGLAYADRPGRGPAQESRSTASATRSSDAVSATRTKRSPAGP
ncbi:MFS transporter [Streptomyces sp. NPDC059009]|uniref:MFS transporter n=1 Tax=Streptomyces sp. NPDC059009 TaxID=3346694 RepID=UPI0036C5D6B0